MRGTVVQPDKFLTAPSLAVRASVTSAAEMALYFIWLQLAYKRRHVPRPAERGGVYFDKFYKDEVALWAKVLGGLNVEKKYAHARSSWLGPDPGN
jgi:hypothetical protein